MAIATSGILKEYLKVLENEPEDLIGKDEDDPTEVDERHLFFGWKSMDKNINCWNDFLLIFFPEIFQKLSRDFTRRLLFSLFF